ncbi:MAG: DMT family transporter [Rubrivivax sp.]
MTAAATAGGRGRWWLIPPLLALSWGLNWPAVKIMLAALPPFTLRWWGLGAAGIALLLVALVRRRPIRPRRGETLALLASGLFNVAGFNVFTTFAQLNTSTSRAAVLTYTMPLMMALMAWPLLGERLTARTRLAVLIGGAGIALLAWPALGALDAQGTAASHERALLGLSMPLLAALSWALGTVVSKRWPLRGDKVVNLGWQMVLGALVAMAGALLMGERVALPLPPIVLGAFGFHVAIAMVAGYSLWFMLLERLSASVSALTTLAVPVVGVLGAMAIVGEQPAALDWLGFAAVLGAAAVVMLPSQRR